MRTSLALLLRTSLKMQSMLRLKREKNIQSVPFDLRELAKHLFFFFFFLSDGTCKPYNGTICSRYISKDTKVFVQQLRPQRESEKKIIHAASVLTDYMSTQCKDSLLRALCYNLFAPCQGGKHRRSPRRLCKDDCEVIQGRACSKEIKLLNERLGGNAEEIIPNCSSLPFQSTVEAKNCLPIRKCSIMLSE